MKIFYKNKNVPYLQFFIKLIALADQVPMMFTTMFHAPLFNKCCYDANESVVRHTYEPFQ